MNTSRMNRLEELGRVDAEKAYTKKGKANLSDEKARIVREVSMDKGGKVKKKKYVPDTAKTAQHPHSKLKTQKELKKITDSSSYKKADYKGKTEKLGGKVYNYKDGGSVMGRGQGKVMRNKPTYIISMKD